MSRERLQERTNSFTENLLGSSDTFSDQFGHNVYVNPIDPDAIPSSPPPSYQRVLEETRLAAIDSNVQEGNRLRSSKRTSFDCHSTDQLSPGRYNLTRRANTISADELYYPTERESRTNDSDPTDRVERETVDSDADLLSNTATSETSLWQDYQEPSTSYDASSRQLDGESVTTLPVSQLERDEEDTTNDDYNTARSDGYECVRKPAKKDQYIEVANKTSKEMYAALAKELGLSCLMSENCRCADCQGGYLKCTENDHELDNNTDGGLGAGTPMFVSEVFGHGTAPACIIL